MASTRHKFNVIFIRGLGVVLSAVTALLSLRVFLDMAPTNAATFIGYVGWLMFVPLAQLGFGRPCYAEVRSRLLEGTLSYGLVDSFIKFFLWKGLFTVFGFGLLSIGFGLAQGYEGEWSALLVFAIGVAGIAVCTFQRDLAYALDKETVYESLEVARRATLVLVYIGIWHGLPIQIMGLIAGIVGLISYLFLNRLLMNGLVASGRIDGASIINNWRMLRPGITRKAWQYFGFSFNEVVFYNIPLIMFTIYPISKDVIYFGVWSKLFLLLVLPMRIFIDTSMNHVTALYFTSDRAGVWRELTRCSKFGVGLFVSIMTIMYFSQETLLILLNAHRTVHDEWFLTSMGLWAFGNVIQHTYGSFTISYREGFRKAFFFSLASLVLVGGTLVGTYLATQNLGLSLAWSGGMYILSSFIYMRHVFNLTHV